MTIKTEVTGRPDVAMLADIHQRCFVEGWKSDAILEMLSIAGTVAFLAENGSGFGLLRHLGEEAEILTLAVVPELQQKGIGSALVQAMKIYARELGTKTLFLEVSEQNNAARALYEKCGFSLVARRKDYYRNPDGSRAHALVLHSILK